MENFILIFLTIFIGYFLNRLSIFPQDSAITLNKFVIFISLPAMIFLQIPKLTLSFDIVIPIVISWCVILLSAITIFFLSKLMNFSKEITGALLLVGVLTNSSFLGIPIIEAFYGGDALPYVMVYDQLGTFLALATYGTFIASYYSAKTQITFSMIVYKIITFPPFIALILSLFFIGVEFPTPIKSVLSSLAATIVPVALVAVGLQLQFKLPKNDLKPFGIALTTKLIFAPIIAIIICTIFSWNNLASQVSILEAAMAPMITAGAMASMAGLAPRLSSAIVGYGAIISFLTTYIFYRLI